MKANTTEPMLDEDGKQVFICGFPCVINHNFRLDILRAAEERSVQELVNNLLPKTLGAQSTAGR